VGKEDTEHHHTFFSIRDQDQEQEQEQSHTTYNKTTKISDHYCREKQSEARSEQER
jgi:hypothetical protein